MKNSYKICVENFDKIGNVLSGYLGEKSDKLSPIVHKLEPANPAAVGDVRIYIEMGTVNKHGVDVHWDMEIDHDDDVALDQYLIDHMSLLIGSVISELEDTLSDVATPHLSGFVEIKNHDGVWCANARLRILKGSLLRFYRWAFKK
jgi:hypothetical protein